LTFYPVCVREQNNWEKSDYCRNDNKWNTDNLPDALLKETPWKYSFYPIDFLSCLCQWTE